MDLQFKKNLKISLVFMVLLFFNLIAYFCIRYFTSYMACILIFVLIVALLIFIIIKNKKYIKESNEKFRDIIKNVIIPVLIVLVVSISIIKIYDAISNKNTFRALFSINASGENFKLDTNNRYLVITDSKQLTYMSDGGSNYNVYYEIDLDKNTIKKLEDHYIGFKGYEYIGKVIENKKISNDEATKLKALLNKIFSNSNTGLLDIQNKEENTNTKTKNVLFQITLMPSYYTFSNQNYSDIKVYNEEILNEFKILLNE